MGAVVGERGPERRPRVSPRALASSIQAPALSPYHAAGSSASEGYSVIGIAPLSQ